MSLYELPVEILENIFSHLDPAKQFRIYQSFPSLCALALTCRRISDVATDILYSHIELVVYTSSSRRSREGRGGSDKYLDSMMSLNDCYRSNPYNVDRTRSLTVQFRNSLYTWHYNKLLSHLSKSTSLIKLYSDFFDNGNASKLPALFEYNDGDFPRLKTLDIRFDYLVKKENYFPAEYLVKLCELPSLDTLKLRGPVSGFTKEIMPATVPFNLKRLFFTEYHPISVAALESILPRALSLKYLEFSVPSDATEKCRWMSTSTDQALPGYDLQEPLRPSFYGDLLAPLAAKLEHLSLFATSVRFPSHDESKIDLSSFTNMSYLFLSGHLLFGSSELATSCPWALNLYTLLPPRLNELNIRFDNINGIFWTMNEMRRHTLTSTFDRLWARRRCHQSVGWIFELLKNVSKYSHPLKYIRLNEYPTMDKDQNWKMVNWRMTRQLRDAASAAGVELAIVLIVPRAFKSTECTLHESSLHILPRELVDEIVSDDEDDYSDGEHYGGRSDGSDEIDEDDGHDEGDDEDIYITL
ncbi:hypothetical protein F4804DRAFT_330144 [Jackrogersella minutella]|nr:hypothetical protein F4804DRAFT_330144 [Jackrogersella minutella]